MYKVKLKKDAYKNHRPPHRPWYLNPNYESLADGIGELIFYVKDDPYSDTNNTYIVNGFLCGDSYIELKKDFYYMQKRDCEIIN